MSDNIQGPEFKDQVNAFPSNSARQSSESSSPKGPVQRHQSSGSPARNNSHCAPIADLIIVAESNEEQVQDVATKPAKTEKWIASKQLILIFMGAVLVSLIVGGVLGAVLALTVRPDKSNAGEPTATPSTKVKKVFETTEELYQAADLYLLDKLATLQYGDSIGDWDVSQIRVFDRLFTSNREQAGECTDNGCGTTTFNEDISQWNMSNAESTVSMFQGATIFDQALSRWDVSRVKDMTKMFYRANNFNGNISSWDVSSVTDMYGMFGDTYLFNQDLSRWNVSSVISMRSMFFRAYDFNQGLSGWNVSSVTNMDYMFRSANSFNQDLSSWDVSSVATLNTMFYSADSFGQDLCAWRTLLPLNADVGGIFGGDIEYGFTSCPNATDPALPAGPMCHVCD